MNRVLGFMLFFIGVGMLIALIFPKCFFMLIVAGVFLLVGYNLFC
ncbi:MAG: hypothetical protein ACOYBL_02470 [Lachnospiraceae bacterium]|jgi:hypothetical protein